MPALRPDIVFQDLRYALRNLRRSAGFTAAAVLTLALGIGASTAVFTVVDSVLLKPLPYPDSAALVVAWERVRFLVFEPIGPNPRHVDIWRNRATALPDLTFLRFMSVGVATAAEHPQYVGAVSALPNLFDTLQVQPAFGRGFLPEDGINGRDDVAILTWSFWQSFLNGDPSAIGKTIRVENAPRRIVGILPARFHFPDRNALRATQSRQPVSGAAEPSVFLPAALDLTQFEWNGNYGNWITLGRLRPGASLAQAQAQLTAIQSQITAEMPHGDRRPGSILVSLEPLQDAVVGETRLGLELLMDAVLGLMLIACLNLANAQLARAIDGQRDAAVRTALGAARWRLIWHAFAENLLLALVGGAAGIALAYGGVKLLRSHAPVDLPRLSEIHLNFAVLCFASTLVIGATLLCSLLPAWRFASMDPNAGLQKGSRGALGSRQGSRLQACLIAFQVFGCTALLLVTGLFSRSLLHLLNQDIGFSTAHTAIAEVRLSPQAYGKDQSRISLDDAVLQNLRAIPGVQSAALISAMPLEGESWIEGVQRVDRPQLETPVINFRWVSPGYFETTGQRLLAGRFLEERDRNLNSTVLSQSEAKALWGGADPIGGQVRIEGRQFTVVGVVADSRNASLKSPPPRMAYVHYADRPPFPTYFMARAAAPIESILPHMRQAIWSYDPNLTIARVKTLDTQISDSLSVERFQTLALISFGAAALLLAMLGIYGVLNYAVEARRREIGVRMALGASRGSVYALTLAEAGVPVLAGLIAGLAGATYAGRLVQKLLYGVPTLDVTVTLGVIALFLAAAALAAFLPARRAASIDPMAALR